MKQLLFLLLISCLASCAFFTPHKRDIEQGNLFTEQQVHSLRTGMTIHEVKHIMGEPMMQNIFTGNEIVYVYTMQPGGKERTEKQVVCTFKSGRLTNISTH